MLAEIPHRIGHERSALHRLDARVKVVVAGIVIACSVVTPLRYWPLFCVEASVLIGLYAAAKLPWLDLLRRLAAVLPFVALVAVGIPLSRGFDGGWEQAVQVVVRALLATTAMITLVGTTRFSQLLAALQWMRVPTVLLWIVSFMYRYAFVLADELHRIKIARESRMFRPDNRLGFRQIGSLVGVLFLRAFERAERVYAAMCARGWNSQTPLQNGPL